MAVSLRPVENAADRERFIRFEWDVYAGKDPAWVPPLLFERREFLDPKKNPFYHHAEVLLLLAEKDGRPVGRISAHTNAEHDRVHADGAGFFGFFECLDDPEAASALLGAAEAWLREKGRTSSRGPFSFSINDHCGVLVDGHDIAPYPMMSHSPPYYDALLRAAGYEKVKDLLSWGYVVGDLPKHIRQIADACRKNEALRIRPLDKRHLERDVRIIMDVFNEAWARNWGYVPLTDAEILKMAKELELFVEPELCLIAEVEGEPAAISFALPNVHELIRDLDGRLFPFGIFKLLWRAKRRRPKTARLIALGIRPKFRGHALGGKGLSVLLYADMHLRGQKLGLTGGEVGWTLEDNVKINRGIEFMGAKVQHRHRIYGKGLAPGVGPEGESPAAPAEGSAAEPELE